MVAIPGLCLVQDNVLLRKMPEKDVVIYKP